MRQESGPMANRDSREELVVVIAALAIALGAVGYAVIGPRLGKGDDLALVRTTLPGMTLGLASGAAVNGSYDTGSATTLKDKTHIYVGWQPGKLPDEGMLSGAHDNIVRNLQQRTGTEVKAEAFQSTKLAGRDARTMAFQAGPNKGAMAFLECDERMVTVVAVTPGDARKLLGRSVGEFTCPGGRDKAPPPPSLAIDTKQGWTPAPIAPGASAWQDGQGTALVLVPLPTFTMGDAASQQQLVEGVLQSAGLGVQLEGPVQQDSAGGKRPVWRGEKGEMRVAATLGKCSVPGSGFVGIVVGKEAPRVDEAVALMSTARCEAPGATPPAAPPAAEQPAAPAPEQPAPPAAEQPAAPAPH
jgi:hypothetical protein